MSAIDTSNRAARAAELEQRNQAARHSVRTEIIELVTGVDSCEEVRKITEQIEEFFSTDVGQAGLKLLKEGHSASGLAPETVGVSITATICNIVSAEMESPSA